MPDVVLAECVSVDTYIRGAGRMNGDSVARRMGAYLRSVREQRGLTLYQVSNDIGWTVSQLQRLEASNKRMIEPYEVRALCDYYGINEWEVLAAGGFRVQPDAMPGGSRHYDQQAEQDKQREGNFARSTSY